MMLFNLTQADAVKWAQTASGLPPVARLGIVAGLGMVSAADFAKYRDLFLELVALLGETERGQRILKELGIADLFPPVSVAPSGGDNRGQ